MDEHATDALRRRESSIYKAIELVRNKEADAIVSAGHSGATMSLATLRIGRIKGIKRPAIATFMPTIKKSYTLVLDVGANVDSDSENLYQFGLMGEIYSREVLHHSEPKIGLLSNGEEDVKGNAVTKEAFAKLKTQSSFIGNVEGNDIFKGEVDVVVCDGFVGNILLKTSEGVADTIVTLIKEEVRKSGLISTPYRRFLVFNLTILCGALIIPVDWESSLFPIYTKSIPVLFFPIPQHKRPLPLTSLTSYFPLQPI
jgi:glycerol-3-phosphate acyltransferase PlsX